MNAAGPQHGTAAPRQPRRLWPWVVGGLALVTLALLAGGLWALVTLADAARDGLHVVLNGGPGPGWRSWERTLLQPGAWDLTFTGVMLMLAALCVIVPLAVVLTLLGVVLALGIALLVTVMSVAAALSPVLLVALVLWLALCDKPARSFDAGPSSRTDHPRSTASMAS